MREALFVVDKHPGPTSFDIVREMKRLVPGEKVGHTGSLDPFASGVLVLLVGKATKMSNVLLNADKSYLATIKLGESTDSMDRTGKITESLPVPPITQEQVLEVLKAFEGEWHQTPPMYSAKKIQGVRLYKLARQNIEVVRETIPVQLYRVDLVRFSPPLVEIEVHCSKGTYIRSLADEIGRRLGTVAHLTELRRLSCGDFRLEESVTLERLAGDFAQHAETGYRNFLRLLRAEAFVRRSERGHRDLQMPPSSGKASAKFNRTQHRESLEVVT